MEKSSFDRLASINVNEHTEKKNGLTYLSWAWAVDQLMRADPAANWEYLDPLIFGETMMVRCSVTAFGKTMTSHLPVMDYRNKPIPHPNAFEVNTAMQRCLVKAIALHGLGLYIYAGEDLPEGAEATAEPEKKPNTPTQQTVDAFHSLPVDLQTWVSDLAADVTMLVSKEGPEQGREHIEEMMLGSENIDDLKMALWSQLDAKTRAALKGKK